MSGKKPNKNNELNKHFKAVKRAPFQSPVPRGQGRHTAQRAAAHNQSLDQYWEEVDRMRRQGENVVLKNHRNQFAAISQLSK